MNERFYLLSLVLLAITLISLTSRANQQCYISLDVTILNDQIRLADSILAWNGQYRCMNRDRLDIQNMYRRIQPPDRSGFADGRDIIPTLNAMIREAEDNIGWAMAKNSICEAQKEILESYSEGHESYLQYPAEAFCNNSKPKFQEVKDHLDDAIRMIEEAIQDRNKYIGMNQEYISYANNTKAQLGTPRLGTANRAPASFLPKAQKLELNDSF